MTAALLREAAQTLREKAEVAEAVGIGPWSLDESGFAIRDASGFTVATQATSEEADYIATMHPAVALAVAHLLDGWADDIAQHGGHHHSDDRALAVARAVLRRES